jgi:replicative DNA helicase
MEMSAEEIGRRYLSGCSGMSNIQLMTGECMGVDALIDMTAKFASMGLYVDDTPALSLTEIKAKARKMMIKHDVKIFFVDYLQLMRGQRKEREQEVSELSRGLKAIARDLKVPFVVLSQLNRKCEERADKKPLLSDLRDSGAIEQDADIVLLLSSPKRNGFQNVDIPDVGEVDSRGLLLVNIAKNRNGGTGDIYLKHNDSMTIIEDFESGNFDDNKF